MNAQLFAAAILIKAAVADFSGDADAVASAASVLQGSVDAFDINAGIAGALGIQSYFPTLSSAVGALSGDVGSLSADSVDIATLNSFGGAVVSLLESLAKRADDISSIGASQIVGNDITSLSAPAAGIVSGIVDAVKSDCAKVGSLTSILNQLSGAFSSAADAYKVAAPQFPAVPSCDGSSGSSSAAESSAPAKSSAAESSAPTKSSAAASSSAPAAASSAAAHSAPVVANAGSRAAAFGVSGALVGVAAMLL